MASVKKRGNNTWQIRIHYGKDQDGKPLVYNETYHAKAKKETAQEKEARLYAEDLERRIKNGEHFNMDGLTLNEFFRQWAENYAETDLTPSKVETYKTVMEREFLPRIGYLDISKISPLHLQPLIKEMEKKRGLKPSTIKSYFTPLSSILTKAYRLGIIRENPCGRLKLPKQISNKNDLDVFSIEESRRFLKALDGVYYVQRQEHTRTLKSTGEAYYVPSYSQKQTIGTMWVAFFYLALYSGARRGELVALTWKDLDFDTLYIDINKTTAKTEAGQIIKEPKTKSGYRSFDLPPVVFDRLREWKEEQRALCYNLGTQWKGADYSHFEDNFVFTQFEGKQLDLASPTHKMKEILTMYNNSVTKEEDKLPMLRLHDLRHTNATLLIDSGVPIADVSYRLGHSKISMTLDIYTHALRKRERVASQTLIKILDSQEEGKVLTA